jgi:DNA modification methylase
MTELIWEGKYKDGKRVAPVRIALPFQTVETVNESAQERQLSLMSLYNDGGSSPEWRNRLIWGDKKYVLPSLLPEFAGKVNLIYIDPPFDTGADFSFTTTVHDSDASFTKEPSMIEQKAYRDTWGRGLDSYLQWFYESIVLLRELLSEDGSIYVHLDWHIGHYAKTVLDEVFGPDRFVNEIVWCYSIGGKGKKRFARKHDTMLFYSKGELYTFNGEDANVVVNRKANTHMRVNVDADGREYQEKTDRKSGKVYRYYVDEGKIPEDYWIDIEQLNREDAERVGYDTQKPETLLRRIVSASSKEGDLVLDCFCGSGTTAAVAEKLGRRWIACDLGRFAIHTTRKRLLGNPNVKPFMVQNLGKYERQAWQAAEFGDPHQNVALQQRYRRFILDLYHADPITGYTWLHGVKAGRFVHVASVDAPVALGEVKSIAMEMWKAAGRGAETGGMTNAVDVLGWDFAFEINEVGKQMAQDSNVHMSFKRIPREVLEKRAVEQGDIRFYELAALSLKTTCAGRTVTVELRDFMVSPDDAPADVQSAITRWSQWIDYWAVDWDYRDDTFHNQWQSYRTRKDPELQKVASHGYEEAGTYTVMVKVIDILGNDTTKAMQVTVRG